MLALLSASAALASALVHALQHDAHAHLLSEAVRALDCNPCRVVHSQPLTPMSSGLFTA